jgi:molybdopterin-guanine dinucleotide biosynthesis protein A
MPEMGSEISMVAVLAGGQSGRMGREKTRLRIGGRSILERILAAAAPLNAPCILIANDPAPFADLGLAVYPDLRPGLGPLAGLHSALSRPGSIAVLLLAGDLPFLTHPFLQFLVDHLEAHHAVVPRGPDGLHPLCAVYRQECLPAIERALDRGDLRMTSFFGEVDLRFLEPDEWKSFDPHGGLLTNVNTPEEYRRAQELASRNSPG